MRASNQPCLANTLNCFKEDFYNLGKNEHPEALPKKFSSLGHKLSLGHWLLQAPAPIKSVVVNVHRANVWGS